MIVVLDSSILEICCDLNAFPKAKKIFNIIYNDSIQICFTRQYIALLEKTLVNYDMFSALITELNDTNRIKIESTSPKQDLRNEFIEISQKSKLPFLIPLAYSDSTNLSKDILFLVDLKDTKHLSRNWIALELLSSNLCNVCYQDFKNDSEIIKFFESMFSLPSYIKEVHIFDREPTTVLLTKLKGRNIKYYTILRSGLGNAHERKEIREDLRTALGGKLKLYYSGDYRKIHERKIIIDDVLITMDNSRNNLTIAEPTWEISMVHDNQKGNKWKDKCKEFIEVTD